MTVRNFDPRGVFGFQGSGLDTFNNGQFFSGQFPATQEVLTSAPRTYALISQQRIYAQSSESRVYNLISQIP